MARMIHALWVYSSEFGLICHERRRTLRQRPFHAECLETRLLLTLDFGDAPDDQLGAGVGNYQTLSSDNGPSHEMVNGLFLGARVDGDSGTLQNVAANADDQFQGGGRDDEDGVLSPLDLLGTVGARPTITVLATNMTGTAATLYGWIDYSQDGAFDSATERAFLTVPDNTSNGRFTLTFPAIPPGSVGQTYARLRLSTDSASASPVGPAADGEVEDHVFTISRSVTGNVQDASTISSNTNGGPVLSAGARFGESVTALGDLDQDGVADLAVGSPQDDTGGVARGAVHILFMNRNGTIKNSIKLASGLNGTPSLNDSDRFGQSVANLGDLDGDGRTDLAVGAARDDTGGTDRGAVYILNLNSDGTASGSFKIATGSDGGIGIDDAAHFGDAVAVLGDLNGDSTPDLLIGSPNGGTPIGAEGWLDFVRLDADGSVAQSSGISTGNGQPIRFADAVVAVGDIDGNGTVDVASGAPFNSSEVTQGGSIYIFRLQGGGDLLDSTQISTGSAGGPELETGGAFGISLAAPGDLDGDGIPDLLAGASFESGIGVLYVLFMNADGSTRDSIRIGEDQLSGLALANGDEFGSSLTVFGDLNGDGYVDLAVGAPGDDAGGNNQGAIHILFLNSSPPTLFSLTGHIPPSNSTNADALVFRAKFNKAVQNVDAAAFSVDGTTTATVTRVTSADGGAGRLWDITISGGDLPSFNGTVALKLSSSQKITDLAGETLTVTVPTTNEAFVLDNIPPGVVITPDADASNSNSINFTFQFSEGVIDFDDNDISVTNGTKGTFSPVDGDTYTLVVTPTADGTVTVNVGENSATDAASNGNTASSGSATSDQTGPVFTSVSTVVMPEKASDVLALSAVDDSGPVAFRVIGGQDAVAFTVINGTLQFATTPNFESPSDDDHNNEYRVDLLASDQLGNVTQQSLTVIVAPVSITLVSGSLLVEDTTDTGVANELTVVVDTVRQLIVVRETSFAVAVNVDGENRSALGEVSIPMSALTGNRIQIETRAGNDVLNVTLVGNSPINLALDAFGGLGDDEFVGSELAELFDGGSGADSLTGGLGNDSLFGGEGPDTIAGDDGNDLIDGLNGSDAISGGNGDDSISGGDGADVISGDAGNDQLIGGPGDDRLLGFGGRDLLTGNEGNDTLDGGSSVDTLLESGNVNFVLSNSSLVGLGIDSLSQIDSVTLIGGNGANTLDASAATFPVTLFGGAGNDILVGGTSSDRLNGGTGNDSLSGLAGRDSLFGTSGNDTLDGGSGADQLVGGDGLDIARRKNNVDIQATVTEIIESLNSQMISSDSLIGIEGVAIEGGVSANLLNLSSYVGIGGVTINGGGGNDTILGSDGGDFVVTSNGNDLIDVRGGNDTVRAGDGSDTIRGGLGDDDLQGEGGTDSVLGEDGHDVLSGGTGLDVVDGGSGLNRLRETTGGNVVIVGTRITSGDLGNESPSNIGLITLIGTEANNLFDGRSATAPLTLQGGAGDDTLLGSQLSDVLLGGAGNDVLSGGAGNDSLDGGSGIDVVYEVANADFTIVGTRITSVATGNERVLFSEGIVLVGGASNNRLDASQTFIPVTLLGGRGADTLFGGSSDDVLLGGNRTNSASGADSLIGNAGADTFDNDSADTRITDANDRVVNNVFAQLPTWIDAL